VSNDRLLFADGDLEMLVSDLEGARRPLPGSFDSDPETVECGLARLVLTLVLQRSDLKVSLGPLGDLL
jgi:hypothetical protein